MPNLSVHQTFAMLSMSTQLVEDLPDTPRLNIVAFVQAAQGYAAQLHKRYEAMCSYEWANTDKYERRTEKLEALVAALAVNLPGVTVEHQRDPRGWPVIVKLHNTEIGRLG